MMATRNRVIVIGRWVVVNGRNVPAAFADAPNLAEVSDLTAQDGGAVPPTPNVGIFEIKKLSNAALTVLQGMVTYQILATETYDDVTMVVSSSNFDNVVTAAQLQLLKTAILTRFPDVSEDTLTDAGQAILGAELTRDQLIKKLARRWDRLPRLLT
jgi:hypothetical protein